MPVCHILNKCTVVLLYIWPVSIVHAPVRSLAQRSVRFLRHPPWRVMLMYSPAKNQMWHQLFSQLLCNCALVPAMNPHQLVSFSVLLFHQPAAPYHHAQPPVVFRPVLTVPQPCAVCTAPLPSVCFAFHRTVRAWAICHFSFLHALISCCRSRLACSSSTTSMPCSA